MVSLVRWYAYRIESLHVFVYLTYGQCALYNHMDIVPYSGHLVIYLDIYDSSGVTVRTLSPLAMSSPPALQSERPNVLIILSCHLAGRSHCTAHRWADCTSFRPQL